MALEFLYGERGYRLLKHQNYKFSFGNHLKSGCVRWRCTNKLCKAKLLTDLKCDILIEATGEHNHKPDMSKLKRQTAITEAKKKAMGSKLEQSTKVNQSEIVEPMKEKEKLTKKDLQLITRNLKRIKRKSNSTWPHLQSDGLLHIVIEIREDVPDIVADGIKAENEEYVNDMSECDEDDIIVCDDENVQTRDRQIKVETPRRRFNESEVMDVGIKEIEAFQAKYMNNMVCTD